MTDIQKTYTELLEQVSGKDWNKDTKGKVGSAGIAIIVSALDDGKISNNHLKSRLPDFSQTEIRLALKNLLRNQFLVADPLNVLVRDDGKKLKTEQKVYRVSLGEDESLESTIVWGLIGACAQGWIERGNKD